MTEPDPGGNPPGGLTEFELLASLQIFGVRADASATFGSGIDTILAARFDNLTLGEVLTYLVSKAEPGLNFQLTPPWDLLNDINLRNVEFEVDITNFRVGIRYDNLDVSFPLISLERIEVWYRPPTQARSKSVDLSLFGTFLGADFTSGSGLTWDVLSQPAPSAPGQGSKYFDLEYLGVGQHVTLRDPAALATLAAVIQALESSYQAVDPGKNPLATLTALKFDGSSGWLFGAKFSALETVTLSAVFNDPVLYGLRLALDGKRVGKLAGLEFEILYRKISDSLGVFHIELKLPDSLRKIQAGEADITLPIIDLDVYTNGDFLLDLGFPHNLDFSRSFQIDMIVWAGPVPIPVSAAAGLYFGVLDGQTASQVPQVTNGSFAPVIVAGFGVRVGLGKSVSIGPLDAGFFAGIIGILEGVLAWFQPDSDPTSRAVYYKITGTVGIQIHIWGTVNFAVLQASLDIDAYATATVAIESYQPIEVGFEAGISISLTVTVLFFHVNLSFNATISESFTIGQASPTPWVVAPPSAATPAALAARGIVRRTGGVVQASPVFAHVVRNGISWRGLPAPADTAPAGLTLGVYLQPMLTAGTAGDRPGEILGSRPQPQLVAMLFVADRGQMEGALAAVNADQPLTAGLALTTPDGTPLTRDGKAVFTQHGDTFRSLAGTIQDAPDVFSLGFLTRAVPGLLPPGTAVTLPDGTVTLDGGGHTVQDRETLSSIAAQLLSPFEQLTREALLWAAESAQLSVQRAQAALGEPASAPAAPPGPDAAVSASQLHALYVDLTNPGTQFSLSRVVGFLTSRAITFDLRPMPENPPQNPSFTVFPMPPFVQLTADGTTIDFGTGPYQATTAYQQYLASYFAELAAPPPPTGSAPAGTAQPAAEGQPESVAAVLFADYFAFILRQLVQDALDLYQTYPYQAAPADTLPGIADRFGIIDPAQPDAAVAAIAEANKGSSSFFATGARLTITPRSTQVAAAGETLRALATRLQLTPLLVALVIRRDTGVLAAGSTIQVAGGSYVTGEGDTLGSIAAGLAAPLEVVTDAASAVPGLLKALTTLALPGGSYVVRPPDTLASIAAATGATPAQVAAAAADVPDLLYAGIGFALPTLPWTVTATDSLDAIADRFGTTLAAVVAGANASTLLLQAGAPVTFGLTTQTRPGETLAQLAQRFGIHAADMATALGDQAGLLGSGATLTIGVQGSYVIKRADTLASIAASFGTTAEAIITANPAVNGPPGPCWSPVPGASLPRPGMGISMPVGLRINLPVPLSYQVGSQDTLAGIAARFGLGVADLAPAAAGATLAPQVTVVLPPVSYQVAANDTPLSIAARFGLTAGQLVLANTDVGFGTVVVPDAELLPLDTLAAELARGGSFDSPGSSLARFLLHGLRLPSPDELPPAGTDPAGADLASQRLYPMYTLTGQQITPPDPLPGDYGLTLAANTASPRPAVTFAGGAGPLAAPLAARDKATLAGIAGQLAQSPPIDAGVLAATRYPPYAAIPRQYALGKPVSWQAADQPPLSYDPAGTVAAPAAAGRPTLLPFPDALRHQVAVSADADPVTGAGLRVGLASGSKTTLGGPTQTTAISGFGWATKADFGLRRVPDPNAPGQPLANVYEVFGVSQDATADLRQLLDYARDGGGGDLLRLALLYPLSATSAAGPGFQSDPAPGVLLVKANLSTRSNPPVTASAQLRALAAAQDGAVVTAATMADARDFLTLLWEATVTNTGGYYLCYRVGQDGLGLPASIFTAGPTATVSLLVTVFPAAGGGSTIPLRAFHNTALVTDNLPDPNAAVFVLPPQLPLPEGTATLAALAGSLRTSVESLGAANATTANLLVAGQAITVSGGATYQVQPGDDILSAALALGVDASTVAQAIKDGPEYLTPGALFEIHPEWLTVRGTVQPGAAGFRLIRTDPDPAASEPETPRPAHSAAQDPKTQLEVLFNLVGYQLLGTGGFRASAEGLPAGPARQTSGPLNHQLTAVGGVEPWIYAKQLRIDKFAASAPVAALDGQQDPYAGVGGQASFGWQPQDVFGNRLLAQQSIEVGIGYTDELVALSQWPSVVTGYQFTGPPGAAAVQVDIALDTSAYVPAPGEVFAPVTAPGAASPPTGIAAQASAHRDRYASIFWQLSHDLTAEVTTTVDEQAPHPIDVAGLAAFASGAYGYLATVAGIVQLTTTVPAGGTLQSIADTYQVSPAELAQANRSAAQTFAAASLLALDTQLTVENRCTVIENDTLAGIVQRSPTPVPGGAGALAAANPALDVTPGVQLAIPAHGTVPVTGYRAKAGATLASVAAAFGVTAADIGTANAQVPGLLAAGQSVLLGVRTYTAGQDDTDPTFASIAAVNRTTVASLATANARLPGLLVAGQAVAIPRHVVLPGTGTHQAGAGDTLGMIAQRGGVQVTALGSANSDVTGLLASGVQLGYTPSGGRSYSTVTVANDTLSTVALRLQAMLAADGVTQQVTVALLAEANEAAACLAAGAALLVPPADVMSGAPVTASNPEVVFPLQTAVTLRRTRHVDPALAAAGAQDVGSVTTPLAPAVPEGAAGQTLALQQFATAFEAAFTAPQFKLATTGSGSSGSQAQQLFAVQYGTPALNYDIGGGTPYFFAPRPLSTALWNSPGPIPICGYTRGQQLGGVQQTSFTGADLDGWAQAFLAELDLVLSGNYAVAAYALDPASYTALVHAKNTIAAAIRDSVDTVTEPGGGPGPDLAGAQDALYQRLLITLSTAYQVDTIVQFPVAVTAPADWGGDTAPRLRGQPLADTYTVEAGATLSSVASDHSFQAPVELLVSELADTGFLLTPGFEVPGQGTLPPYTVAGGDTLASVAAHFAMPVGQLGDALAGTPGLLLPGAAVNLVRRTYPLAADDTLFTVISYLALDVSAPAAQAAAVDNFAVMNATLPDLFAAGTILEVPLPVTVAPGDTIAGLAAAHELTPFGLMTSIAARTDVLTPGASVTLAGQAVTIRPGDSLDSIAAEAGLSLDAVTSAVQDAAGLLASGVIIALPGSQVSYTVRSGDTLAAVAAAVGQGATPSWVVTTQLDTVQALRAGTVVAYLSRVAGFTLSDANISLAGSSPGSLTFLFRTASNTAFSNLALRLRYQVNQLEYGIEDVPWASGYQSSQWLTFLLPPPDAAIGTVDVPIPLRAHPVPPSVTSQRTIAFAGPLTLQELRRYDYDYSFSAQRAAQDAVSTSQLQNTVLADGTTAASTSSAPLPGALAQYAAVRDGLEQDLALLTRVDPVVPATAGTTAGGTSAQPPPAQQALQVFTKLAGQIAQAWAAWAAPSPASPPAPSPAVGAVPRHAPRYQVRRGTLATGEATVHLRPDGEAAAAHASDLVLGLRGHAAADASGDAAPGVRGHAGRRQVTFTRLALPADAPAPSSPGADEFDLLVPDRDVVTTQNIWGEVSVTRNASLLAGRPTNPAFIYAVPDVKAATPAVPLISWTGQFDLASVPFDPPSAPPGTGPLTGEGPVTGARPLADWLINFFDSLLNRYVVLDGDTVAKIAMRYDLTPAALAPAVADVPGLLAAGTELPLPGGGYHQVADGDTLASVAAASSIQLADLVQAAAGASGLLATGVLIRPAAVSRTLRVAVDYGFPLATATAMRPGQESEIVSRLPVLLCPAFLFDSATDLQPGSGFCAALAQQLTGWASARGLPDGAGRWVLDVSLYTTLPAAPGAPAAQAPPLLELTNVRLDRRLVQHNPLAPGGIP